MDTDQMKAIEALLAQFTHPTLKKNLKELDAIKAIDISNDKTTIHLVLPFVWNTPFNELRESVSDKILDITGTAQLSWRIEYAIATLKRANDQAAIPNVKNIIVVSSGKGGVGKSSTAVNLALALKKEGAKVGLLDADIYGPSIPDMLSTQGEPVLSPDNKHMKPIEKYGIISNSIGYLVEQNGAMIWRGPMASKALLQMLQDTLWGELDYLVVDLPPGTGDIQLTLGQSIPVTASVIVTTPQDIALIDVKKGLVMFDKVNIPVVGIVENMSYHICESCGHKEAIFGTGGAEALAKENQTQLLAQIPLNRQLQEDLDKGLPTVEKDENSSLAVIYRELADKVSSELYWQGQVVLPEIAIKNL